jgi:hypothetical protein
MRSRCCLCVCVFVCVSALSLLDNGSIKISYVARQRIGRNVTAVTNTHATIEELMDASFSVLPVSYQKK